MGEKRLTELTTRLEGPDWLQKSLNKAMITDNYQSDKVEPVIVDMESSSDAEKQLKVLLDQPVVRFMDVYDEQLAELFISDNAQLYKSTLEVKREAIGRYFKEYKKSRPTWKLGAWVYYPWSGTLVHMLGREQFIKLRTIRNQFIVSPEEQQIYTAFNIGCAGMSVGSNGAAAIVLTGGSHQLKIADGAVFSGSNLNRVRTGVESVGLPKTVIVARELYEMNPYVSIDIHSGNITSENIESFFDKPWKLDCVVDEIDDVIAKIRLRIEARKRGIPVIMVTEPGDTVVLDVERFDINKDLPLFHGLIKNPEKIAKQGSFSNEREKIKNIVKIIGVRNLPIRDQEAALKVGSVIPSAPQLGSTAMIAGGIIAYAARQIATGAPLRSGRKKVDINSLFWKPTDYLKYRFAHEKSSRDLSRVIRSM